MTYHNRPVQLRNTLKAMSFYMDMSSPDLELIIVDDASDEDKKAKDVLKSMCIPAIVVNVPVEMKTWTNPSVPYNLGFAQATKEIVIIQNSECLPIGDVFENVRKEVTDHNYVVFQTYSTNQKQFQEITDISPIYTGEPGQDGRDWLHEVYMKIMPFESRNWYHHLQHLPTWYHFTTAMTLENLRKLKGFNEVFANGYCFEDNEFLFRIRKMLTITDIPENEAIIIHQWHPKNPDLHGGCPLWERNRILWDQIRNKG
jgi:hypothetical protein